MPLKYKKPNYNETLSNIVNGLEEKVSGRAASVLRQPIRNLQTTIQVLDNDGSILLLEKQLVELLIMMQPH